MDFGYKIQIKNSRERRQEYGRNGEGGGGGEVEESDSVSEGPRYAGTEKGDVRVVE